MDNKKVNDILKKDAEIGNLKYYWKRYGTCNYRKCGGACCRYGVSVHSLGNITYFDLTDVRGGIHIDMFEKNNKNYIVSIHNCKYMTKDCRCKKHKCKDQPTVCDKFPMLPADGVYVYVKDVCGYYFKKVINKKYKKIKKQNGRIRKTKN